MQVIHHSETALRTALISKDRKLVKLFEESAVGEKRLLGEGIRADSTLFKPITVHSASDWIPSHAEATQDFQQFYKDPFRSTPSTKKSIIYLQPIGSFGDSKVSTEEYIEWLKDYCAAFFHGVVVKVLVPVSVSDTECVFRANEFTENLQIHAVVKMLESSKMALASEVMEAAMSRELLSYLKNRKPADAYCIMGITMIDLYPTESWNFVFGQASTGGVGIFSFARYDSSFYSKNYEGKMEKGKQLVQGDYSAFEGYYMPPVTSMLLLRSCKTLTHEIGHIFGLHHCQWLQCVMQGSNHFEESDRRPLELCPICLRKLQSAVRFNIAERYKALLQWIDEGNGEATLGISASAGNVPRKMVEAFTEHRSWILQCLTVLQT